MDNYIIRIYRRDREDPRRVAGMVELVEREEKKAFTGIEELVSILVSGPGNTTSADDPLAPKTRVEGEG